MRSEAATPARTSLDRATIVSAALDLLDEVGLDALSTRRLAAALGVQGPSLYWHFKSMGELRDHMAEAMLAEAMPSPQTFEGDWRAWLAEGAWAYRRAATSRRDGARVLAGARPTGQHPRLSFPPMVARLTAAGFTAADARESMAAIGRYVLGWALGADAARLADSSFEFGLEAMLDGLAKRLGPTP